MSNLVSPEDLEKWFMSIPPAELAKQRHDVKADLATMSDTPLDRQAVNDLSHRLFELTVKHNLNIQMIMDATNLPHEAILRLQSGNPFVKRHAFDVLKEFADNLEKTGKYSFPPVEYPNKISKEASILISDRIVETMLSYYIDQKTMAEQSGLTPNEVNRLTSENEFVSQRALDIMLAYLDQVDYWKGPKPDATHTTTRN